MTALRLVPEPLTPFFEGRGVTVYAGDVQTICRALERHGRRFSAAIADPPYAETSHRWDRWPAKWPAELARVLAPDASLWCFGSLRMFLERRGEFAGYKYAQELVWRKTNGSGPTKDRFRRVHEIVLHTYRGAWGNLYHGIERVKGGEFAVVRPGGTYKHGAAKPAPHRGGFASKAYVDDGLRYPTSVVTLRQVRREEGQHPTAKPPELVELVVKECCPPGGELLSLFSGGGPEAEIAVRTGRRCVCIEADAQWCAAIARRVQALP